jgi:aryl-alcohol dehydrogenase-like predicted oxidoreductase
LTLDPGGGSESGLTLYGFSWGYRDSSVDETAAIDVIRHAIDLGVDHFDMADV